MHAYRLDRVLSIKRSSKRLSAWRKLLQGQWRTSYRETVTLTTVTRKLMKVLMWSAKRDDKIVSRVMRVKCDNSGQAEYVLAGGAEDKVQLWRINTNSSCDHLIVWRAYNSSFCKLDSMKEITYSRVQVFYCYICIPVYTCVCLWLVHVHVSYVYACGLCTYMSRNLCAYLWLVQLVRPRTKQTARKHIQKAPRKRPYDALCASVVHEWMWCMRGCGMWVHVVYARM